MCVICLTAIFKVEDILRKILGFGSTKADHGSAVKSIAKTAFAMQLGKRVLDNGKKIVGGTKNVIEGSIDKGKAKTKLERRKKAYFDDNNLDENGRPLSKPLPSAEADEPKSTPVTNVNPVDQKARLMGFANKSRELAKKVNNPEKRQKILEQAKKYESMANSLGVSTKASTGSSASTSKETSTNSTNTNSRYPKDYHQKLQAFEDQYKEDVKAANKKKREGLRTMARGIVESGGAVIGATAGGVLGFADGNINEGLQGMVSGAGIGDAIGSGAVTVATAPGDFAEWSAKTVSDAVDNYKNEARRRNEAAEKDAQSQVDTMNQEAQNEINRINQEASRANAELQRSVDSAVARTADEIKSAKVRSTSSSGSGHGIRTNTNFSTTKGISAVRVKGTNNKGVEVSSRAVSDAVDNYSSTMRRNHEEQIKSAESELQEMNRNIENEVSRINKDANKASDELQRDVDSAVESTTRQVVNITRKAKTRSGSNRTYQSRHGGIKTLNNGFKNLEKNISTSTNNVKLTNDVESID